MQSHKFIAIAATAAAIQGCASVIPINKQIVNVKEIAACVSSNSHGYCRSGNDALRAQSLAASNASYFSALSGMDLPVALDANRPISTQGIPGIARVQLNRHISTYSSLGCPQRYSRQAAETAKAALMSPTNRGIHSLFDYQLAATTSANGVAPKVEFNAADFNAFLQNIKEAESYGGLDSIQCATIERMMGTQSLREFAALESLESEVSYVKEYFKAYFRQGRFIKGALRTDQLYGKLKSEILSEAPFLTSEQVDEYTKQLFKKVTGKEYAKACGGSGRCDVEFAGKLEATQFVTRAGVEYGFPHITVSLDPLGEKKINITEIDWTRIGAEIARVYIEAVGDKLMGLPADPRSTACKIGKSPCFTSGDGGVSDEEFAKVSEHADKVDALVSTATGKMIRGAGWISLNNEAIASIVEAAVGTTAKKAAEKVAFCTYSCLSENGQLTLPSTSLEKVDVRVTR